MRLIALLGVLFVLAGCSYSDMEENYVLSVYPDKNNLFVDMTVKGIGDIEQCRLKAKEIIEAAGYQNADYECGIKCVTHPDPGDGLGDTHICEETKR